MAAKMLRLPDLLASLGDPLAGYSHLDFEKALSVLMEDLSLYEQAVSDLTRERKLRDEALVAKQEAVRSLKMVLANVGRVQEGYFRMAGLDELADRIRLTIPRSSKPSKFSGQTDPTDPTDPTEQTVVDEKEVATT